MLTVEFKIKEDGASLELNGHCEYAEKGKDIVCASASILCNTLAEVIEKNRSSFKQPPIIDIKSGNSVIEWQSRPEYVITFKNVIYTIMTGFSLLAEKYPEHIQIIK